MSFASAPAQFSTAKFESASCCSDRTGVELEQQHFCLALFLHRRTARLWSACQAQPLLSFTHLNRNAPAHAPKSAGGIGGIGASSGGAGTASANNPNPAFVTDVTAARFFYMDQFVLLAAGSKLHLYRWAVNATQMLWLVLERVFSVIAVRYLLLECCYRVATVLGKQSAPFACISTCIARVNAIISVMCLAERELDGCFCAPCRFNVCEDRDDDIERLRNNNKYKLAYTHATGAQVSSIDSS